MDPGRPASYRLARPRLWWWVGGIAYSAYCLFGHMLPEGLDNGFSILLSRHGAVLVGLVCAGFAIESYRLLRIERRRFEDVTNAWIAEQPTRTIAAPKT